MYTYTSLPIDEQLGSLRQQYQHSLPCAFTIRKLEDEPFPLVHPNGAHTIEGEITFNDFIVNWFYYPSASITDAARICSSLRKQVLSITVLHPKSDQIMEGWVLCQSPGNAIERLNKLSFLAGAVIDFD